MQALPDAYDAPWKETLDQYLPDTLAFLFPTVHAAIDWHRPHFFLDTELQAVVRDAELGLRRADRLVQVWLPDGHDAWLLIHLEVQTQEEPSFARRMFTYWYRLFDRYNREVVSLAVLGDERAGWRPDHFRQARWGCAVDYQYPVVKLADWRAHREELEGSDNPVATVILAHLAAQDTRGNSQLRHRTKLGLIRRLYVRGYSRDRILSLFRLIDWLLALPKELDALVWQEIAVMEKELQMTYVTSVERLGLERGLQQGRQEGLEQGLEEGRLAAKREDIRQIVLARFGALPDDLEERLTAADEAALSALLLRAATAATVDEW